MAFHENQIAGLRAELGRLRNEEEEAREKLLQEMKEIQEKREYLLYKKLSGEYYAVSYTHLDVYKRQGLHWIYNK